MAASGRDARRRKISERGPDRLALITGQIQNLSSSSSSSSPHHSSTVSSPELSFDYLKQQSPRSNLRNVSVYGKEDASDTASPRYDVRNESPRSATIGTRNRMEPQLQKCETSTDNLRTAPLDMDSKAPASMTMSPTKAQNLSTSTVDTEPRGEPQRFHSGIFTANRISSSISASERARLFCSISIALVVVLSQLRFPLLGSFFVRSTIMARPVYLILLTDVTLVLARLLFEEKGHSGKAPVVATQQPSEDGYGWAEGLGKALEIGLILHKVIGAAFLDCSVYLVIVVCALSLVQSWL